jgi:hypothetical protein
MNIPLVLFASIATAVFVICHFSGSSNLSQEITVFLFPLALRLLANPFGPPTAYEKPPTKNRLRKTALSSLSL